MATQVIDEAARRGRWSRELHVYPDARTRYTSLGIVVLATVVLYYQLYLSGGVAVEIMSDYGLSFRWFVMLNVVALGLSAAAAHLGGLTDRLGRANLITGGLVVVGLLCAVGVPLCDDRWSFALVFCALNAAEGVILVATPALVRDFSPQLGRASAMGFWTMGPVLGSLVVTLVVGSGAGDTSWPTAYVIAGVAGLVVAALSVPFLKELAPALRDQVMVEETDRALVEARVQGIDLEEALARPGRQMLKADIILPSIAISLFLLFYISMVAFGPTFFEVVYGYSLAKANNVLVWAWVANIAGLVLAGWASDKLLVRKPVMLVGALVTGATLAVWIRQATQPETSYATFAALFAVMFFASGAAYVAWMAAFTETVERRNPALTGTGLAVWGLTIRVVFGIHVFLAPFLVDTVNDIVDHGATVQQIVEGKSPELTGEQNAVVAAIAHDPTIVERVQSIAAAREQELAAAAVIAPEVAAALEADPHDPEAGARAVGEIAAGLGISPQEATARLVALAKVPQDELALVATYGPSLQDETVVAKLAYLDEHGADVVVAVEEGPRQWRNYFLITLAGIVVFLPMIWLMAGHWSPRRARKALAEHEARVAEEMARISA